VGDVNPLHAWRIRRRATQRVARLPEVVERIASAVRAGGSVRTALAEVARDAPPPLDEDLAPAALVLEHGGGLDAALSAWATATGPAPELSLVLTALALAGRAGGEVARALDRVAATLRERRELRAEVRALATQARASAAVLIAAPLGFAGLVSTIEPGVTRFLVTTPLGALCLVLGLGLDAVGAWWMARIVASAAS
jgi:tight adherence protein B